MTRALELAGKVFGELTVVRKVDREGTGGRKWECLCSCGKRVRVVGSKLIHGHTKSCGHLRRQARAQSHGDTYSREYNIWTHMRQRCTNPNRDSYYRYGGRGIRVCEAWDNSYEAFLRDMGRAPFPDAQIDRINVDGDYAPDNCRWVSPRENKRNKGNARLLTHNGITRSLQEWSEILGLSRQTLQSRVVRNWTADEIISGVRAGPHAPRRTTRWIFHEGQRLSLTQWATKLGMPMKALHQKLRRGRSMGEIIESIEAKGN